MTHRTSSEQGTLWPLAWNIARLLMVAGIVCATVEQARLAASAAADIGADAATALARLFSFFTVQSNVLAAVVLAVVAIRAFVTRFRPESIGIAVALAAVSTYMIVTGIVYNVLLRSAGDVDIMMGWSNDVHHIIGPAFLLADVLLAPGRRSLRWRTVPLILIFPLGWVGYTLLRGPSLTSLSTGAPPWYPYPFLDPTLTDGGYVGVLLWVGAIALLITGVAALVILVSRRRTLARRP